jgi:hypothetical protein
MSVVLLKPFPPYHAGITAVLAIAGAFQIVERTILAIVLP